MAKGKKTGGRVAGTPNKKTLLITSAAEELKAEAIQDGGVMPAEMLLHLSRLAFKKAILVDGDTGEEHIDEKWAAFALDAGSKAAPYFHGRLQVVEQKTQNVGEAAKAVEAIENAKRAIAQARKPARKPADAGPARESAERAPAAANGAGAPADADGASAGRLN